MASYTTFVNDLHTLTGLNVDVLTAWAKFENGVNNNVLGVTVNGKLASYATPSEGAHATAALLQSNPAYAGILASVGGTSQQQALAIAKSPWHTGKTTTTGDPWYVNTVFADILKGNSTIPSGGASTPVTAMPNAVLVSSPSGTKTLADALGLPADQPLTIALINSSLGKLEALSGEKQADIGTYLTDFIGKPLGQIPFVSNGQGGQQPGLTMQGTPSSGAPSLDIVGVLMFLGVVIVGVTFIGTGGLIALKRK